MAPTMIHLDRDDKEEETDRHSPEFDTENIWILVVAITVLLLIFVVILYRYRIKHRQRTQASVIY